MKPDAAASAPDAVAKLIRQYLAEHPRATDTSQGIQRWWLAPIIGEVALRSVELALLQLEGEGVVRKLDPLAENPAYGRGPNATGIDQPAHR
jgi:hypothetical protein